jgi:hypothetical protein
VPFPKEFLEKYANKSVAIVGWEIDQVRYDADGTEHSVPISATYNHHYNAQVSGGQAKFEKVWLDGPDDPRLEKLRKRSHGHVNLDQPHYMLTGDDGNKGSGTFMASANGGEYRRSYHGFAPGKTVLFVFLAFRRAAAVGPNHNRIC